MTDGFVADASADLSLQAQSDAASSTVRQRIKIRDCINMPPEIVLTLLFAFYITFIFANEGFRPRFSCNDLDEHYTIMSKPLYNLPCRMV